MKAFRALYRQMTHVFLNAKQNLETVRSYFGVPENMVTVLPIADLTAFTRTDLTPVEPDCPDDAQVVLFFGQIQLRKGLDTLVEAYKTVAASLPKAYLYIVGQAQIDVTPYEMALREAGLQDRFQIIARYATFEEMAGFFNRADVVALPYETGWNSGVLASAMGFGKPVVATRVGGFDEVVQPGVTGLLVPPKDPQALSDALIRVLSDNVLQTRFKQEIPQVAAQYSWREIAQLTQTAYHHAKNDDAAELEVQHA